MMQRFVCFKFKAGTPQDAIDEHMRMFAALQDVIPQIVTYAGGAVVRGDTDPPSPYDSAHVVTFAAREDIDAYFHHEAHQAFIAANKTFWDDVLVVDSEVSG
jgi:hypothetical protein